MKKTDMASAAINAHEVMGLLYNQVRDPARDGLVVGGNILKNHASKAVTGAVKNLAPEVAEDGLSQTARTVVGAGAGAVAGGLLVAYDVHKAKPEEKKWVLGRESASTGATIAVGVISGGFLLPIAAGMAVAGTGLLVENQYKVSRLESAHETDMNAIKADVAGHSHLQQTADLMDKAVQASKSARKAQGLNVPAGDFTRDAGGHVDIHDAGNRRILAEFIATQREQTAKAAVELEQLSVLPAGFKSGDKEKTQFELEKTKKILDVGAMELHTMQIHEGVAVTSPEAQRKELADLAKKGVEVTYSQHIYTLRPNTSGTFDKSSPASPDIPKEVWAMHQARNDDNPITVLYKSKDGKSAESMTFAIRDGRPLTMDESMLYAPPPSPKKAANTKDKPANHSV